MIQIGIDGFVRVTLRDRHGRVKRRLTFHNLVTNAGMDLFMSVTASATPGVPWNPGFIAVSTDATAPAFTDVALAGEIARVAVGTATNGYVAATPDYVFGTQTATFGAGVGTGTIAKIGAFSALSGGTLMQEALLLDANGNPTTVVKGPTDTLTVSWQLRVYPPQGDTTVPVTVAGVAYTATYRACSVAAGLTWVLVPTNGLQVWNSIIPGIKRVNALVARNVVPPVRVTFINVAWDAYVPGSFQLTGRFVQDSINSAVYYLAYRQGMTQAGADGSSSTQELFGLSLSGVPAVGTTVDIIIQWKRGAP